MKPTALTIPKTIDECNENIKLCRYDMIIDQKSTELTFYHSTRFRKPMRNFIIHYTIVYALNNKYVYYTPE